MYDVQHLSDEKVIEVRHWGDVSADDARAARQATEGLIEATGIQDVLVDLREVERFLDTVEIYEFAADFRNNMRIAMLHGCGQPIAEDLKFLETVAVNRGNDLSMHASREDALTWLRR